MDTQCRLLPPLTEAEVQWLFHIGIEQRLSVDEKLYCAGDTLDHLYVVLAGRLAACTIRSDGRRDLLVRFGPADIIGEPFWISGKPASETIEAEEETHLLAVSAEKLHQKTMGDTHFGVHFMQAVVESMTKRLHESFHGTEQLCLISPEGQIGSITKLTTQVDLALKDLKRLLTQADRLALENRGEIPREIEKHIQNKFRAFCAHINTVIGDTAPLPASQKEEIGSMVLQELLPYLSMAESERWYSKPRGYAGDYLSIAKIYANRPTGNGRLGPLIDRCLLEQPAPVAVRNRRKLLREHIETAMDSASDGPARVMSLACGPAEELFDVYGSLSSPDTLHSYLIDMDIEALAYVAERRDHTNLTQLIKLYNNNLVYLACGRERIDVPLQNLIYSVGLIDYFGDELVISLINYAFDLLIPGGKLILGNFHPRNADKAMMDHVFQWRLIHRSEEDMNRLFLNSRFEQACSAIHFEEQGINLFAECIKS